MKLRRRILIECDTPGAIVFNRDERLLRVQGWIEIRLTSGNDAGDGAQQGHLRRQEAYTS